MFRYTYLTRVLTALLITRADHAIRDVQVPVFQPRIAEVAVQNRDFHLVYFWFVLRHCGGNYFRCEVLAYLIPSYFLYPPFFPTR